METKDSITSRPWFICPTWAAVMPLLADAIARNGDYGDEAAAARAELMRLAAAMDTWNKRAPRLIDHLRCALDLIDEGEIRAAHMRIANALRTARGGDCDLIR